MKGGKEGGKQRGGGGGGEGEGRERGEKERTMGNATSTLQDSNKTE